MHCKTCLLIFLSIGTLSCSRKTVPAGNKEPVWSDEFNYTGAPDSSKWNYETGYLRNNELQFYTARPENVRVEDGNLVIEARNDSAQINGKIIPITSASIVTHHKASWTYGKFEIRAKIPSALGSWPAIWLLGNNIETKDWPACGEIDIMENVGFNPDFIYNTVHTKAYNHGIGTQKGTSTRVSDPSAAFHVYALDWSAQKIDFILDGMVLYSFPNEGKGEDSWPFDRPFYMILNFAFGGEWGAQKGVDLKALPLKFYIDYVRVYQ